VDVTTAARVLEELGEVIGNLKTHDFTPAVANSLISALKAAADVIGDVKMEADIALLEERVAARLRGGA